MKHKFDTLRVIGAVVLVIVGLVIGLFGNDALGWIALLFLGACFGTLAFIAVLSLELGRKS